MFISVFDAAPLPGGGVVVLDIGAVELRFFDQEGELIAASGGEGEGPGEFLAPWAVEVIDGVVWAWDYRRRVVSSWSPAGEFIDEWRVDHHVTIHEGTMWPDGSLAIPLYDEGSGRPPPSGSYRPPASLIRYPSDGGDPQDLGNFPWDEMTIGVGQSPFRSRSVAGAGGEPLQIYVGDDTSLPKVRRYDSAGRLLATIDLIDVREKVPSAAWRALTRREQDLPAPRRADQPDAPELSPAFTNLVVDPGGRLWVITKSLSGEQTAVVYSEGAPYARVQLPPHERVLALDNGELLVLSLGPLDTEVVEVFSYRR